MDYLSGSLDASSIAALTVDADEVAEIVERAAAGAGSASDASVTPLDVPSLRAAGELVLDRGATLIWGLPIDDPPAFLACCSLWGTPPSTDARSVFDIRLPAADEVELVGRARTTAAMRPHTDSALSPTPDRLIAMAAVRTDAHGGGLSELVFVADIQANLRAAGDEPLDELEVPFAWDPDFSAEPRTSWLPVGLPSGGMRWHSDLVAAGCDIDQPDTAIRRRVEDIQRAVDCCPRTRMAIPQGVTLLIDNHRVLHGRTALRDPTRLLRRVKLAHQ